MPASCAAAIERATSTPKRAVSVACHMKWRIALVRPGTPRPCVAAACRAACETRSTSKAPEGPRPALVAAAYNRGTPVPAWMACCTTSPKPMDTQCQTRDMARPLRFPAPLRPGDRIAVTAPSAGVTGASAARIDFCLDWLRGRGYDVVVGECLYGDGLTSAPAEQRAAELTRMLADPDIHCVVPPWGGETAIDMVDLLDWDALAEAEPTWLVGYSDLSTLLAARHDPPRLGHAPRRQPRGHAVRRPRRPAALARPRRRAGAVRAARLRPGRRRGSASSRTRGPPSGRTSAQGRWEVEGGGGLDVTGRLIGGCAETVANLAGTPYGDVRAWAEDLDEPTIVYVEACEEHAINICRYLHSLRLAGWFDRAAAVLVGRTSAPDHEDLTQREAVLDALGRLDVPIVWDLEIGHVPPHLPLVNGALARVVVDGDTREITQSIA